MPPVSTAQFFLAGSLSLLYIRNMPSLQPYQSHGHTYYRIVESFRRPDGKPALRVLLHLGKADDLLARLQQQDLLVTVRSVSAGAVDAAFAVAQQLRLADRIDDAIAETTRRPLQTRDGLSVGQSLTLAAIARLCHPCSKRAIAEWAAQTSLPDRFAVPAAALTSQHFWDQMNALPSQAIAIAERHIVSGLLQAESLRLSLLAYDTTNFYTHIDSANTRPQLPQRGHNKQHRHNLRQLGLALVVSEEGQIPLAHAVYEGSRNDARSFRELIAPLRQQLQGLPPEAAQCTLIFDAGPASMANLQQVRTGGDHYVTTVKPSEHRTLLAEAASKMEPVTLGNGEKLLAWRGRREIRGHDHTLVILRSEKLRAGQQRGFQQQYEKALRKLAQLSPHPRSGIEGTKRQVQRIVNRQYLKQVLQVDIAEQDGQVVLRPSRNQTALKQLEETYWGLRLLLTTQHDWTTAQIIESHRGQARVERAFRDLKDPWAGAFRPQYHWTDQKLMVHAFIAVLSLLIGRLLLRRAQQRVHYRGTVRTLIEQLGQLRRVTLLRRREGRGRPAVREQLEQCSAELTRLATALDVVM
jgi:transposase